MPGSFDAREPSSLVHDLIGYVVLRYFILRMMSTVRKRYGSRESYTAVLRTSYEYECSVVLLVLIIRTYSTYEAYSNSSTKSLLGVMSARLQRWELICFFSQPSSVDT